MTKLPGVPLRIYATEIPSRFAIEGDPFLALFESPMLGRFITDAELTAYVKEKQRDAFNAGTWAVPVPGAVTLSINFDDWYLEQSAKAVNETEEKDNI